MSEWIKCSERMPEDFTDVLVTDGSYVEIMTLLTDGSWLVLLEEGSTCVSVNNITHWMSLPKLPEV